MAARKVCVPAKAARGGCPLVPQPQPLAGGFWFPRLSAPSSSELRGFITLGWYIEDQRTTDPWSRRFLQFKNGRGIKGAAAILGSMLEQYDWSGFIDVSIIAAMGSGQTVYDAGTPTARLAELLAKRLGFRHLGNVLRKKAHKKLHGIKDAAERGKEVAGKYQLTANIPGDLVLVCDDMITRGDTQGEIARAIRARDGMVEILGIGLGKSEKAEFAKKHGVQLRNSHLTAAQAKEWDGAG